MDHPNATLYRDLMAKMTAGDVDGAWELVDPAVRWHEAGNPDVIVGRDAVRDRLTAMSAIHGDLDIHDVLANDEHVLAMLRVSLTGPAGKSVEYPVVEVAHVSDGKVTERWSFMDACPEDVTAFFAAFAT
ncbi:MAG: nuclear transport factor 2 family protein [Nocardioidaceae bacterium]